MKCPWLQYLRLPPHFLVFPQLKIPALRVADYVLREELAADPLLRLAQGAGPRTVTQQKGPCGCPVT